MTKIGDGTLANAGHLAPYLNGHELAVTGSLPVGMVEAVEYENQGFSLAAGDRLTLYTDGVLEARNAQGKLLGFDCLQALLSANPRTSPVADTACSFGQDTT
jgi:serine phosphatase RsbU (regulator of sigma subunit)